MLKIFVGLAVIAALLFYLGRLYRRNREHDLEMARAAHEINSRVNNLLTLFNRAELRWVQARRHLDGTLIIHFSGETVEFGPYEVNLTGERLEAKGELPNDFTEAVDEQLDARTALTILDQLHLWCAGKKGFQTLYREGGVLVSVYRLFDVIDGKIVYPDYVQLEAAG